jgi:molybdate transport system substrate-binding protein
MKKIVILLGIVVMIILIAFIANLSRPVGDELLVCHVGGTMKPVVSRLAELYEQETGQKIEINSAGSGELLAHINLHQQGDVYVSHDPFLDILMQKFKMGIDGWLLAELTPVIAVKKGNPKNIKTLKDLTRDDVELILTDYKGSSLGRMLSTIFSKASIDFEELNQNKKIHTNRSGGYAANFVMMDNADATMVWNAVAKLREEKLDIVPITPFLPAPRIDVVTSATGKAYYLTPMRVTVATLVCSKEQKKAKQFAEYIASEAAQAVFEEYGFTMSGRRKLYEQGEAIYPFKGVAEPALTDQETGKSIRIYAGAGLRKAIDMLIATFEEQSNIEVDVEYGGSGIILTRAQLNQDVDIFMPGDISWVQMLQDKTNTVESMTKVSYFVPTIIVPQGNPKNIQSVEDFVKPDLLVGLGREDACQVGKISTKILENYSIDRAAIQQKQSLTVNEIGVWVKMKSVDVGIVWDAIAANMADDTDTIPIPSDKNISSTVAAGLMKTSKNKDSAQQFVDFLISPSGQAIFQANGFRTEAP